VYIVLWALWRSINCSVNTIIIKQVEKLTNIKRTDHDADHLHVNKSSRAVSDSVGLMCHRSSCRRRAESTSDYDYD